MFVVSVLCSDRKCGNNQVACLSGHRVDEWQVPSMQKVTSVTWQCKTRSLISPAKHSPFASITLQQRFVNICKGASPPESCDHVRTSWTVANKICEGGSSSSPPESCDCVRTFWGPASIMDQWGTSAARCTMLLLLIYGGGANGSPFLEKHSFVVDHSFRSHLLLILFCTWNHKNYI